MPGTLPTFVGIDVGTSGVRVVAADAGGNVRAQAEQPLPPESTGAQGTHEQNPDDWWRAVCEGTEAVCGDLAYRFSSPPIIGGVAVTSTSGSLVVADAQGVPLRPAILYDDIRSAETAQELNRRAQPHAGSLNASYSLVKAAWVREHEPSVWEQTRYLLHPADWLTGKLTGEFGISDYSNSLKLGFDPERGQWTDLARVAGLPSERLPRVARPGERVGVVSAKAALETGLAAGVPVLAGATDGMTCLLASGACRAGDANTTLGTTLVWKVLCRHRPGEAPGVYCHLHPSGLWAPGAASNAGPGSLQKDAATSPEEFDRLAASALPTSVVCYMLRARGERFPFVNTQATTFVEGEPATTNEWYAAQLQSIAFVERWGCEVLQQCGAEVGTLVYSSGAAARSPVLSQLRANVLNRSIALCCHPMGSYGAAILAATGTHFAGDISAAIQAMTRVQRSYAPSKELGRHFDEIYRRFREACARRGYI